MNDVSKDIYHMTGNAIDIMAWDQMAIHTTHSVAFCLIEFIMDMVSEQVDASLYSPNLNNL